MDCNTVPIKFRLETNSCRRARIKIPLAMSAVTSKLMTCFPELKPGRFAITYKDEEGDEIEVMNDADLAEAMAVFNAIDRVLSFSISPRSTQTDESDDSTDDDSGDGDVLFMPKRLQNHRRRGGRRGGCRRRWHALAHMLGMRPREMKPQMQNMMRFGMLNHFVGNGDVDHTCELHSTFVSDVTFDDGAVMQPNQSFNKKWLIKTGAKAWPAGCTLVHVGGHPMGTRRPKHRKFTLGAVPSNSEIEVMVVLQTPRRSGAWESKWRMCNAEGIQFGDTLWASINVAGAATMDEEINLECKFVADGSIPDGTTLQPNQQFDKKWVIKTGKTAWPAGCKLVHVSGHAMGTKRIKFQPAPLPGLSADSEIVLQATMQAPKRCHDFISKWRMVTKDGRPFGDYLWTFINVEETVKTVDTDLKCTFVADATIPDHSSIPPKECFEKKWIVKTGPTPWPAGCVLTHVGGHPMGTKSPKSQPAPLPPLPANVEAELSVCLKAPKPSRDFVSKWRMQAPDGRPFGDFLWALITVEANAAPVLPKATAKAAAKAVRVAAKAAAKEVKAAAKAAAKDVRVAGKAAAKAVKAAVKKAPGASKAAAKAVKAAAKAAAKDVRVAGKAAAKAVKAAVKKAPGASKAAAKAVKVAAKAAAKDVRVAGNAAAKAVKAAVKKAPVASKAAAKAVRVAVNAAAKAVKAAVKKAPVASKAAAKAATNDKSMKLQKLLELNFPVPVEVLQHVLDSVGGNLNAAIEVLVNQ